MSADDPLAESLSALSTFFVGDGTIEETLHRVATMAKEAVPGADMTGISLLVEGRPRTAVFTHQESPEIDSVQYETGKGPCLDSFREQQVLGIPDTTQDERWRAFAEAAAAHGIRSTLSLPLVANHRGLGALNFYSRAPRSFCDDDVDVGSRFAAQAAIVLANSQVYWDAVQLSENLTAAMKSRAVIEQAKGVLMGARRCDADAAFQILVRASQRENRKLREVAEDVVAGVQQPTPPPSERAPGAG